MIISMNNMSIITFITNKLEIILFFLLLFKQEKKRDFCPFLINWIGLNSSRYLKNVNFITMYYFGR